MCVCVCVRVNNNERNGRTASVKAPVISHQSQFTGLTSANGPHAASLAAGILIEKLRAVTFSHHFSFMQNMVQVTFVCTSSVLCHSPLSHLNYEISHISYGEGGGLVSHLHLAHGRC